MKRSFILFFACLMAALFLTVSCAEVADAPRHARDLVSDVGDGISDILTPDSTADNSMGSSEIPAESGDQSGRPDDDNGVLPGTGEDMLPEGNGGVMPMPTPTPDAGTDGDTALPEAEGTNTPSVMDTSDTKNDVNVTDEPETSKKDETTKTPETTKAPESDDNDFDEPEENASLWGIIVAIVVVIAIIGVVVMLIPKKRK